MNEKPPSTSGSGTPGLVARVMRAIKGEPWSRDEIQTFIQDDVELDAEEKSMLSGVLEVSETQVREVMVPRSQMVVIDIEDDFNETLKLIVESGHSRFPVIGEDRDEVLGILLAKDLLRYYGSDDAKELTIKKLLRPASVIPESKRLNALLKEFRASHNHMAIVVDEYGGVAGLLTIEDVLEEIVGEIDDEHDIHVPGMRRQGDDTFIVDGRVTIRDLNREFDWGLPDEEASTIAGLVLHEARFIPEEGQSFDIEGLKIDILRRNGNQLRSLRITPRAPEGDGTPAA